MEGILEPRYLACPTLAPCALDVRTETRLHPLNKKHNLPICGALTNSAYSKD